MENKPLVRMGVIVVVFNKTKKKVLMGIRKNAYKAGLYGFPGGRLEIGETLDACGTRELLEETNLSAEKLTFLGVVREGQDLHLPLEKQYDFIHFVYFCDSFTGSLKLMEPDKCAGWEWVSVEKIPQNMLVGHQGAIRLLKEYLAKKPSYLVDWPHGK